MLYKKTRLSCSFTGVEVTPRRKTFRLSDKKNTVHVKGLCSMPFGGFTSSRSSFFSDRYLICIPTFTPPLPLFQHVPIHNRCYLRHWSQVGSGTDKLLSRKLTSSQHWLLSKASWMDHTREFCNSCFSILFLGGGDTTALRLSQKRCFIPLALVTT